MSIVEAKNMHEKAMSNMIKELEEIAQTEPFDREKFTFKAKEMSNMCKAHGEILRLSHVLAFKYLKDENKLKDETVFVNCQNCLKALRKKFYIIWNETNEK